MVDKESKYRELIPKIESLISGEFDSVSKLANAAAAIHDELGFFWTGFYMVKGDKLVLGPFQGSVACYTIKYGKGVCGTTWKEKRTTVVADVEKFPGHIACDSRSHSEITVPIINSNNEVTGVLDIDSDETDTFDETDKRYLETIAKIIADAIEG
jgi:L-methionine (R)-S-oxide reductase